MTTDATASHYAQAFSVLPGRCFCLIGRGGQGPTHRLHHYSGDPRPAISPLGGTSQSGMDEST